MEIFSATASDTGLVSLVVQTCGNEEPIQFPLSVSGTLHGLTESTHKTLSLTGTDTCVHVPDLEIALRRARLSRHSTAKLRILHFNFFDVWGD